MAWADSEEEQPHEQQQQQEQPEEQQQEQRWYEIIRRLRRTSNLRELRLPMIAAMPDQKCNGFLIDGVQQCPWGSRPVPIYAQDLDHIEPIAVLQPQINNGEGRRTRRALKCPCGRG